MAKKAKIIGKFEVLAFDTEHDSAESLGFLIRHEDKKMLFATDTYYLRYRFNRLAHIAIECNYVKSVMEEGLENGTIDIKRVARIMKSHMSLENLIEFLKANDLSKVEDIHLLHLSNDNRSIPIIKDEIRKIYKSNLIIAGGE